MREMLLKDVTFDAVDGEGFNDIYGHHYPLLVASCYETGWKQSWCSLQNGQKQLPTWAILRALFELGASSNRVHVGFYLTYDIAKWLEDLTIEEKTSLWHNGFVNYVSPGGRDYLIQYLPHKLFSVRSYDPRLERVRKIIIYDVFGFFQTSFVNALKDWGLTDEIEFIERMKKQRGKFKVEDIEEITRYSLSETDLLCRLMMKVRDALIEENIPLRKWFGAGSIAEALLSRENMAVHIAVPAIRNSNNDVLNEAILGAYFGGRFELFKQGEIKESHQYDINSAYPSAMAELPSFRNCTIRAALKYEPQSKYSLWFVTYDIGRDFPIGPLPYRTKKGSIVFPFKNPYGVWIHQVELQEALRLYGHKNFTIHGGIIIQPISQSTVYQFINTLAAQRLKLKKINDQRNIVLKLGLNSLYGKTAQAVSSRGSIPPFQNFYIAGYITAATRAKLLAMAFECGTNGRDVIQFATDGIFTTFPSKKIGMKTSERLGEWEYKKIDRPTIYLKPGVYFTEKEGKEDARKTKRRTRGFRADRLTDDDVFKKWRSKGPYGILRADDDRFIGIGSCLVRNSWNDYGRFIQSPLKLQFGPGPTKIYKYGGRNPWGGGERGIFNFTDYYILQPRQDLIEGVSQPYQKHFVDRIESLKRYDSDTQAEIAQEVELAEQPDYEKYIGFGDNDLHD